jgi:predicted membrane chloride channel (bestrophin family)
MMNSLTIFTVVGIAIALYFAFRWGQETGYDEGLVDGRKAVRKYYEQVGK